MGSICTSPANSAICQRPTPSDPRRFETRSLPALSRSYPRHFTFHVAHPVRSIRRIVRTRSPAQLTIKEITDPPTDGFAVANNCMALPRATVKEFRLAPSVSTTTTIFVHLEVCLKSGTADWARTRVGQYPTQFLDIPASDNAIVGLKLERSSI